MKKTRIRVNLSVDEATYRRLQEAASRSGLGSVCKLCRAASVLACRAMEQKRVPSPEPTDAYDTCIADMFAAFTDWERQTDGTVPIRRKERRLNDAH